MKIRKFDVAIVLFFLFIALISYGISRYGIDEYDKKYIMIYSDNQLYQKIAVTDDEFRKTIPIENKYGHNTVKIYDGGVSVTDSDCPDEICMQEGFIDKPGESIICLPHKLLIEIDGTKKEKDTEVDAVIR